MSRPKPEEQPTPDQTRGPEQDATPEDVVDHRSQSASPSAPEPEPEPEPDGTTTVAVPRHEDATEDAKEPTAQQPTAERKEPGREPDVAAESEPASEAADQTGSDDSARPTSGDEAAAARRRAAREEALTAPGKREAKREARAERERRERVAPEPGHVRGSAGRKAVAIVSGSLLVLATAAAAFGEQWLPAKQTRDVPLPAVEMTAGDTVLVCAPTVRRVGGDAPTDSAYAPGAATAVSSLRALAVGDNAQRVPGAELLAADDTTIKVISPRLPADQAAKGEVRASDGYSGVKSVQAAGLKHDDAAWLRVQPLGGMRSQAAAMRTISQGDGDLTGLATPSCTAASNTTVLGGASTTIGHTAVLTITNPSVNPAGVTITVRTADGETTAGSVLPFTLGAGQTRTINLGGTAQDADAATVQVDSSGAAVGATIIQSMLRGTTPGGIDVIQGSGTPDTEQIMPGIQLQDPAASKKVGISEDAGDETPQVAITDLSGEGTRASVVAQRADGTSQQVAKDLEIPAGGVATASLIGLPAGTYTLTVRAEDTVSATARVLRGVDPQKPRDVAFTPAVDQLSTDQLLALPSTGESTLRLAAPTGAAKVSVVPIDANGVSGEAKSYSLAAGTTQVLKTSDFGQPSALRLSGSAGESYASLVTTHGESSIASELVPHTPSAPSSAKVDLVP